MKHETITASSIRALHESMATDPVLVRLEDGTLRVSPRAHGDGEIIISRSDLHGGMVGASFLPHPTDADYEAAAEIIREG